MSILERYLWFEKRVEIAYQLMEKNFQNHLCYFEFKVNDDDEKCELLKTKSTLW